MATKYKGNIVFKTAGYDQYYLNNTSTSRVDGCQSTWTDTVRTLFVCAGGENAGSVKIRSYSLAQCSEPHTGDYLAAFIAGDSWETQIAALDALIDMHPNWDTTLDYFSYDRGKTFVDQCWRNSAAIFKIFENRITAAETENE